MNRVCCVFKNYGFLFGLSYHMTCRDWFKRQCSCNFIGRSDLLINEKKFKRGEHIQNKGKGSSTCTCKRFNLVKAHFLNQEPCNKENNGGKSSSQKI